MSTSRNTDGFDVPLKEELDPPLICFNCQQPIGDDEPIPYRGEKICPPCGADIYPYGIEP